MSIKPLLPGLLALVVSTAHADCGALPAQPALLQLPEITFAQKPALIAQLDAFEAQMDAYEVCVDSAIMALQVPEEDGSEAFFSSPEYLAYDAQFQALAALIEQANVYEQTTIDQYNQQLEFAIDESLTQ